MYKGSAPDQIRCDLILRESRAEDRMEASRLHDLAALVYPDADLDAPPYKDLADVVRRLCGQSHVSRDGLCRFLKNYSGEDVAAYVRKEEEYEKNRRIQATRSAARFRRDG